MENEYCARYPSVPVKKHKRLPRSNPIPSAMALGSCQSSFDSYDMSSDDVKEYTTPNTVAEKTPGRSHHAARLLTAARLNLNSLPDAPLNWGQINSNLNNYPSDLMEISCTFWLPDITEWWRQLEETHFKYADLSDVARDIFSIIRHGVGVEVGFSLGQDVIGCRQ